MRNNAIGQLRTKSQRGKFLVDIIVADDIADCFQSDHVLIGLIWMYVVQALRCCRIAIRRREVNCHGEMQLCASK